MEADLTGRVALVTGGNHGIGAATARALARRGAAVLVTWFGVDPQAAPAGQPEAYTAARAGDASAVLEAVRAEDGRAAAVEADLTDVAVPAGLLDAAEERFGPVSILVNNASGWQADSFAAAAEDRFGRRLGPVGASSFAASFLVDARGAALLVAEFAGRHVARRADWGRIVSLTSGGPDGFPEEASYGAAKAALDNYTMTAAAELGRFGITANVVHPPVTDTGWITPAVEAAGRAMSPFGRIATPEEVAAAVCLLMGRDADRITGTLVRVR